jgi:hypothetical protein
MASSKDMQPSARPLTQHRPSLSSGSSVLPGRQSHARAGSHSLLTGSLNPTHRVTRRKSVTNPGAITVAAIEAAIRDGEATAAMPIGTGSRRGTMSKSAAARAALVGSLPSPPASLPSSKFLIDPKRSLHGSAIDDTNEGSADEGVNKVDKARIRRASDGQPLLKDGKKSNRVEIRCEKCGKGYKHSSCLTKHLLVFPSPLAGVMSSRLPEVELASSDGGSAHEYPIIGVERVLVKNCVLTIG